MLASIGAESKDFAAEKNVDLKLGVEELEACIAISVAMGMLKLPRIRDYWAEVEVLKTPWFPAIMPRDCVLQVFRYFHVVDTSPQRKKGEPGHDYILFWIMSATP